MKNKWVSNLLRYVLLGVCSSALVLFTPLHAMEIKEDAPQRYIVKKGDTLWDISGMYLNQPWRWPELWANNTQIQNPHLIYPGDVLVLRFVDGKPVLVKEGSKQRVVMSPTQKRISKQEAIDVLPWEILEPYINNSWILGLEEFEALPRVLGNHDAAVMFADDDILVARQQGSAQDQYQIVRNMGKVQNIDGTDVGYQINQIAEANMVEDGLQDSWLVKVKENNSEVKRGDRLWSSANFDRQDLVLTAAEGVSGHVIGSLHSYNMLGKYDVVIVDLGESEVSPGTVMGLYAKGPALLDSDPPRYANEGAGFSSSFTDSSVVEQPAIKVGDMVVFSVFEKASFGIITGAKKPIKRGFIVGKP